MAEKAKNNNTKTLGKGGKSAEINHESSVFLIIFSKQSAMKLNSKNLIFFKVVPSFLILVNCFFWGEGDLENGENLPTKYVENKIKLILYFLEKF